MEVQKSVPLTFGEKWAFSKLGNTWTTLSLALVVQRMVQLMHSINAINASTSANIYSLQLFVGNSGKLYFWFILCNVYYQKLSERFKWIRRRKVKKPNKFWTHSPNNTCSVICPKVNLIWRSQNLSYGLLGLAGKSDGSQFFNGTAEPASRVFQVDLWDHIKRTEFLKKVETLNLSDSGFKAIAKGHIYDII